MCELASEASNWLMVDPWEAIQPQYMPTAQVLDHFEHEINDVLGGAVRPDGTTAHVRIVLLAGADLIQTMVRYICFSWRCHTHFVSVNTRCLVGERFGAHSWSIWNIHCGENWNRY